jgi:hypothetical protein
MQALLVSEDVAGGAGTSGKPSKKAKKKQQQKQSMLLKATPSTAAAAAAQAQAEAQAAAKLHQEEARVQQVCGLFHRQVFAV